MAVITAFSDYPEFLPHMKSARVLAESKDAWEVAFTLEIVRRLDYTLRLRRSTMPDGRLRLDWSLVQGVFRSNEGSWTLEACAEGTRATYDIAIVLGMFVPRSIQNTLSRSGLPTTLEAFKQRAESSAPSG